LVIDMNANTTVMLVIMPLAGLLGLAITAIVVLTTRDTIRGRGNWNLNAKPAFCPLCGEPAPFARVPKNWRQCLWGSFTCANCGLEYFKSGRAVDENERQRRLDELAGDPYARPWPEWAGADDRIKPPGRMSKEKPHES
jgi:hypothetical protein